MDIDKPHQLELLREDLARQQEEVAAKPKRVVRKTTAKKTTHPKPVTKTVKKTSSRAKKDVAVEAKAKLKAEK